LKLVSKIIRTKEINRTKSKGKSLNKNGTAKQREEFKNSSAVGELKRLETNFAACPSFLAM
jgi:hypothetical protein